jgi:hypothetical protein
LDEVVGFPDSCVNDDQVDCLSLLGRYLAKMSPGAGPQKQAPPLPIQGGITQDSNGRMHTTATLGEMFEDYRPLNAGGRL